MTTCCLGHLGPQPASHPGSQGPSVTPELSKRKKKASASWPWEKKKSSPRQSDNVRDGIFVNPTILSFSLNSQKLFLLNEAKESRAGIVSFPR